jgi:hypothetical protein
VRGLGRRVSTGSQLLSRRIRRRLAALDPPGPPRGPDRLAAVIGCIVRAGLLLLAAYLLARVVRALPAVLWVAAPSGASPPTAPSPKPAKRSSRSRPQPPPEDPRTPAFARWLLQTIGDRPGIHLYELYPAMRQLPGHETLDDATLRAALRTLGVPVVRSLRVPPVEGRSGVRRGDVEALLSPAESTPESRVETQVRPPILRRSPRRGEWVESA